MRSQSKYDTNLSRDALKLKESLEARQASLKKLERGDGSVLSTKDTKQYIGLRNANRSREYTM